MRTPPSVISVLLSLAALSARVARRLGWLITAWLEALGRYPALSRDPRLYSEAASQPRMRQLLLERAPARNRAPRNLIGGPGIRLGRGL